MGALLKFFLTILFVAVLLWLTFANRQTITLTWSPLHDPTDIAVAVVILAAVTAGFIWGALITWLNHASLRRAHRQTSKTLTKLEKELQTKPAAPTTALTSVTEQPWTP